MDAPRLIREHPVGKWIGIVLIAAALLALPFALAMAGTAWVRITNLAILTLGFGEIVRIFLNNLSEPFNLTNGPKGITTIDPIRVGPINLAETSNVMGLAFSGTIKYYYFLLVVLLVVIVVNLRLQD